MSLEWAWAITGIVSAIFSTFVAVAAAYRGYRRWMKELVEGANRPLEHQVTALAEQVESLKRQMRSFGGWMETRPCVTGFWRQPERS